MKDNNFLSLCLCVRWRTLSRLSPFRSTFPSSRSPSACCWCWRQFFYFWRLNVRFHPVLNVSQQLAHIIERQYEPRSLFMLSFAPQWSLQTAWCVYEKSLFLFSDQFFLFLVFRPVERKHPKYTFRCLILVQFSVCAYFICIIQHKKWNIHIYMYI